MADEHRHFFDKPANVRLVLRILYVACIGLFAADLIIHRHAQTAWEGLTGFYPVFGFVACVALVLVAKEMRKIVMRREDYYDH